jgi:predicted signal transduction protein with EAL and GGDEF domain
MSNPRPRSRFDIDLPRVYSQVLGETEAQLAVVRQLGCDSGQGYFFSEAVSPANLAQWLTQGWERIAVGRALARKSWKAL